MALANSFESRIDRHKEHYVRAIVFARFIEKSTDRDRAMEKAKKMLDELIIDDTRKHYEGELCTQVCDEFGSKVPLMYLISNKVEVYGRFERAYERSQALTEQQLHALKVHYLFVRKKPSDAARVIQRKNPKLALKTHLNKLYESIALAHSMVI